MSQSMRNFCVMESQGEIGSRRRCSGGGTFLVRRRNTILARQQLAVGAFVSGWAALLFARATLKFSLLLLLGPEVWVDASRLLFGWSSSVQECPSLLTLKSLFRVFLLFGCSCLCLFYNPLLRFYLLNFGSCLTRFLFCLHLCSMCLSSCFFILIISLCLFAFHFADLLFTHETKAGGRTKATAEDDVKEESIPHSDLNDFTIVIIDILIAIVGSMPRMAVGRRTSALGTGIVMSSLCRI